MRKLKRFYPRFFGQIFDFAKKTALEAFRSNNQKISNHRTIGDGLESLEDRLVLSTTITQAIVDDTNSSYWKNGNFECSDSESITIDQGVILNTLNATTGKAGNITLDAPSITINDNAQLLANGSTDSQDGTITITANDLKKNLDFNAFVQFQDLYDFNLSASINVGIGTTISGGKINIIAESGNAFIFSNTTSLLLAPLAKVFLERETHTPDFFSLPLAIQVWKPSSSIVINGSIDSSTEVAINSTADANACGKAVYMRTVEKKIATGIFQGNFDGGGHFGAAVGYFQTDASATINMSGSANIQSAGGVTLGTTVDNVIKLEAMANKNNGITNTNPEAMAISVATGVLNTTSTIHVQPGANISASGTVQILAEATDENEVEAKTNVYRDGLAGLGAAVVHTNSTVQTIVEGTINSTWTPPTSNTPVTLTFNPSLTVDFASSSLIFPTGLTYSIGTPLLFQSVDGATVPGLIPNFTYYAIPNPQNPNALQLASTAENASNGLFISFGNGFPTLTNSNGLKIPITIIYNGPTSGDNSLVSNTICFGYSTLADGKTPVFTDGEAVTFTPVTGKFLGYNDSNGNLLGALSGNYTVNVVPTNSDSLFPFAIQLLDSQGNVVLLDDNSLIKTADGTIVPIYSFDTAANQLDLNPPSVNPATGEAWTVPPGAPPTILNGQPLEFISGLSNPVGNLNNNQTYYAVVNPATPGIIQLALNQAQSEAANPAIQNAVPTLLTASNQKFISGSTANFGKNQTLSQIINSNNSYSLWTNANIGSFTLNVTPPQGSATTAAIPYNASAAQVASAINAITGMFVTVSGNGTASNPWLVAGQYQLTVGNFETGVGLVFDYNPNLADGTAMIYQEVPGKPVYGFTNGDTYYAYNQTNPNFVPQLPQYVISLQNTLQNNGTPVNFQLGQWFSDNNGQNYQVSGAAVNEGQLILELPQTALVTDANSSGSTSGSAFSSVVSAGALQCFSFATSGTFTILVETTNGTLPTAPLAFNATASQVEAALNALNGVNVSVTGIGQISSPWTLVGLSYGTVTFDCTNLKDGTYQANILAKELISDTSLVWTTATSGTFTLTLDVNGQNLTTTPIVFDATIGDLISALNALPNVRASVTGAGTAQNPWVITTGYQGIQTGDALVFHDCWNMPSMGMIDGQTYYAVVSSNQFQPQTILLGFAATLQDASASPPTLIQMEPCVTLISAMDNTMTGGNVSLTEESSVSPNGSGVEIEAKLVSMDWATVQVNVGLFPIFGYLVNPTGNWDVWSHAHHGNGQFQNLVHEEQTIKEKIDPSLDFPNQFELSAAPALVFVKNQVQALVGENAIITSYGEVSVNSVIDEILHSESSASIAKSRTGKGDKAVAIAFNGAFVENNSTAIIASNAQVSAEEISVISDILYPFIIRETNISKMRHGEEKTNFANITATVEKFISNALFAFGGGISNWLFNNTANTAIIAGDDGDAKGLEKNLDPLLSWTISFSVSVIDINNTNLAQIADGAQINQDPQVADAVEEEQTVTVEAQTTVVQTGVTGMVYLGLSATWLLYGIKTKNVTDALIAPTNSGATLGGSFNYMSLQNSTQALLGGNYSFTAPPNGDGIQSITPYSGTPFASTKVNYGNGGLTVEAITYVTNVLLSQAGGKSSGLGFEGSFAILNMGEQGSSKKKQTTYAQLISDNLPLVISANHGTDGIILVEAKDTSDLWVFSGAVLYGGAKAIGFSGAQIELTRDISASAGTSSSNAVPTQASTFDTNGTVEIMAAANGSINPVSLVGEYAPNGKSIANAAAPGGENVAQAAEEQAASDIHGKWGWAVSGDYSAALINDSVNSWINDLGTFTGQAGNLLIVEATNTTIAHATSGSAAIVNAHGNTGPTVGISGSASVVVYDATVTALIVKATLYNYQLELIADNAKKVGSFSGGMQVSAVTASDLNLAGSVAFNQITNDTQATFQNVTAHDLEEATIEATSADQVWAAAGMLTITWAKRDIVNPANPIKPKTVIGVGVSGAMNTLVNTTHATVEDCEIENLEGAMDITAEDFSHSFVFSAGVDITVPAGTAVELGGMWSTTNIAPDTQAQIIESTITGATGNHPTNLEVIAAFIPVTISFAGYVAIEASKIFSLKENKIGVGVGAGVVVTNIQKNGSNLAQTLASIVDSEIELNLGELTLESYSGNQGDAPSGIVSPLSELPDPDGNNIWSLAIAGSVQGESAPVNAIGLAIAGALIYTTVELETFATIESNSLNPINAEQLTVSSNNTLLVYTDAGGVTVAGQMSEGNLSVGVAIGGAYNSYNSTSSVEASINDATITTQSMQVDSLLAPDVTSIAYGVAVDIAVATSVGVSTSLSGAFVYQNATDSATSSINGGTITVDGTTTVNGNSTGDTLSVLAEDQSTYQASSGAGSLAGSGGVGAAVSLAPSAAIGKITLQNTAEAYIGSQSATPATTTTIDATVPVVVEATTKQTVTTTVVAVAASVAISPTGVPLSGGGASSSITTTNKVDSGLLYGTTFNSTLPNSPGNAQSNEGITLSALEDSALTASVGAGALAVGVYGGSLAISLAEISTNDKVNAVIRGATVTTSGTGVSVEAIGTSALATMSVPTAAGFAIGLDGAGGNSNITDSSQFLASIDTGASITTGAPAENYGDLTVGSYSQDSLLAQIFGGDGGLGSIGVFLSDTICNGSSTAQIANAGTITVGDLTVQATGNHSITSDGYSITIGGLTGTGETHQLTYSESISTNINENGANPGKITALGSATINAQSNTTAIARDSGQAPSSSAQASFNYSGLGIGVYQAVSMFTPTVSTSIINVDLTVDDNLSISTTVSGSNTAQAMAGSGATISGEASKTQTTNSPVASLTLGSGKLSASNISVQTVTNMTYDAYADSVDAGFVGASGAVVINTSSPEATVNIDSGITLTSTGQIDIASDNIFQRGNQPNEVDDLMVRVGAGGVFTGYGGNITTTFNPVSTVTIADGVMINSSGSVGGNAGTTSGISILASQTAFLQEDANLATGGLLVSLDWNNTSQTASVTTSVTIGQNATLVATTGSINIGTLVNIDASSSASTTTWGLGGNATSSATSGWTVNQSIETGTGTQIFGLGNVSIVTGENPMNGQVSSINTLALAYARTRGLIDIPLSSTDDCYLKSNSTLSIGTSSTTQSAANVNLGANPGNNSTLAYWQTQYDRGDIKHGISNSLTNSSTANINGTVQAGVDYLLDIEVNPAGNAISINGGTPMTLNSNSTFVNQTIAPNSVTPAIPGQSFYPFQAAYNTNYTPNTSSVTDPATAAILRTSVSQTAVNALQLSGLFAQGGNVTIKAGTLSGSASLSAYTPSISITNPSANYLLLDGVSILNGKNSGNISLLKNGGGNLPQGSITTFSNANTQTPPTIIVNQTYPSAVGTGTTSGPGILLEGYFNNPTGNVSITNTMGAIVEIAPIKAVSVTISSPNSAFVLSTPNYYYGVGGNILDAWGKTQQPINGNPTGTTSYTPNWTIPGYAFQPGQTTTGWNANLAATSAADYIYNGNWYNYAPGMKQLNTNYQYQLDTIGYNQLYNSSNYQIIFGNSAPYQGNAQDSQTIQEQTSSTGSGGILAASYPNYFGVGNNSSTQGNLPVFLPDQPIYAQGVDSTISPYLSGGLTAAQVSITALMIDINAPLNVGISNNININLTAALGTTLTQFQTSYQNGNQSSTLYQIPTSYLGGNNIDFTATYNAQTNQITLSPIATTSAQVGAVLAGQIVSTTSWGNINMIGGPGLASINNSTGIPLVVDGINSGSTEVSGTIEIQDSLSGINTKYVYQPGKGLATYSAPNGQPYSSTPNGGTSSSAKTTYNPVSGTLLTQSSSANLWRGLNVGGDAWTNFDNSSNGGFWNFGPQVSNSNFAWNVTSQTNLNPKTYVYPTSADTSTYGGWQFNNPANYGNTTNNAGIATTGSAFSPATPPDADNACAFIQNGGSITQSVYLTPGAYSVSFQAASRTGYANNPIQVSIGGTNLGGTITASSTSFTNYTTSTSFEVTTAGYYTLQLKGTSTGNGNAAATQGNVFIDDVLLYWKSTTAAPSPYTATSPQVQLQYGYNYTTPGGDILPTGSYLLPTGSQFVEYLVATQTTNGYFTANFSGKNAPYENGMPYSTINYNYPTGYSLDLYTYAKADNPIGIDFSALQAGNLSIYSNAAVVIGGGVLFGGNVSINTIGDLTQTSSEDISANEILLITNQGSIGSRQNPIIVNASSGFSVSAFGEEGVYITSPGDIQVDHISTAPLTISRFEGGTNDWSTVNGVAPVVGFSGFQAQGAVIGSNSSSLQLTDGVNSTATSAWSPSKVSTGSFTAQFTYTPSGNKQADGITFAFQNQSPTALGNVGGALGYTGITGQTVAYELNIYNGHQIGTNFVSNNYTGTYQPTGSINVGSGNPIHVNLVYDEITQTITETLVDTVTPATFTRIYENIRLEALLGPSAYMGFTGGDSGATSIQTITNFQFQSKLPQFSGNIMSTIPPGVSNQLSAAWYNTPISLNQSFGAAFVYQAMGENPADGTAFVFQNEGLNALGGAGGLLGYSGINNNQNTAAFEINIYNGHTIGTNFVTNGEWGTYNPTGTINMASGHQILVNLNYDQESGTMFEDLTDLDTGATFSTKYSINLQQALNANTAFIGFTSADGGAFASQTISDFRFGYKTTPKGDVEISAAGDITSANKSALIQGSNISLTSTSGSIGTNAQAIAIDLNPQSLTNGSITEGVFNASATNNIFVIEPLDNLRIGSVVAGGTVSLIALHGDIVEGVSTDASGLNTTEISSANRLKILGILEKNIADSNARTVNTYQGMINRNYLQYWNLLPDGSVQNGVFVVSSSGFGVLEPQVALAYGIPSATNAQVQTWANDTWQQCVTSFESTLAFGPDWQSLPQFVAYSSTYLFIAPQSTVNQLNSGSTSAFGLIAGISLDALQRQNELGSTSQDKANIQAGNLVLTATEGSVGLSKSPVIIPIANIENQTLTPEQKQILTLASQAGEVMMVGTNIFGVTQLYPYGSPPYGIVPTGVQVIISRPLFVDVASGGTTTIKVGNAVVLTEISGAMNIDSISATGTVKLTAEGSITSANSSQTAAITSNDLILTTNAQIGSDGFLNIDASGRVDAYSKGDISLSQVNGNLYLGQLIADGTINLNSSNNILSKQIDDRQSIEGFNDNGKGWTQTTVNGQVSIVSNDLTFTNQLTSQIPTSNWPSVNSLFDSKIIGLNSDFSVNFLYESTGTNGGLAFTLINPFKTTSSSNPSGMGEQGSLSFVLNLGDGNANPQSAGFDYAKQSGASFVPQTIASLILNSGDSIMVSLNYSFAKQTLTSFLTDMATGDTATITQTEINLLQILGTEEVRIGFTAFGSGATTFTQTISEFNLTDGAANLQGISLNATALGSFGTESNPITMVILNDVNITAPNGVYAEQLSGNMNIGQVTSSNGVVSLSAPEGALVQYVPQAPMSATSFSEVASSLSFTPYSVSGAPAISAPELRLNALVGIGSTPSPLQTVTGKISGRTHFGNITVYNTGDLAIGSPNHGDNLIAGGIIHVSTEGSLHVQSTINAGNGVELKAVSVSGNPARVVAETGSNIFSENGTITIFGNDGMETRIDSTIGKLAGHSAQQINLSTGIPVSNTDGRTTTSLMGAINAASLAIQGGSPRQDLHFAIDGLKGPNNTQLYSEVSGFESIHADDRLFANGRSFVLHQNGLSSNKMKMVFSNTTSLLLNLGSGNDQVSVGTTPGLNALEIDGNAGLDSFFISMGDKLLEEMWINGGEGIDQIVANTLGQNAWAASGALQTWNNRVHHSDIENIRINGCGVLNGLPNPVQSVDPELYADETPSGQFVETVFAQVLGRLPSAANLELRSRQLDNHSVSRLAMANEIGTSTEAWSLLVDAWYRNYLGRPAKSTEVAPWVKLLKAGQSEIEVLSQILSSREFAIRIGKIQNGTNRAEHFITGLYRLAIDPSGRPAPTVLANLMNLEKTQGRTAVARAILGSGQFLAHQAESLSIQIDHQPANDQIVAERTELRSSTEMRSWLLGRIWNESPILSSTRFQQQIFTEGQAPVAVGANIRLSDLDAPRNFNHGSLTVNVQVNGTPDDRLSIKNQGAKPGQIGVKGNLVTYSGLAIGSFSGGNGTDPLVVLLNANSTPEANQALLRNISFSVVGQNPSNRPRAIRFVINDGTGHENAQSQPLTTVVQIQTINNGPIIRFSQPQITYRIGNGPVTIDKAVTIADPDNNHFSGGELVVSIIANGTPFDHLALNTSGSSRLALSGNRVSIDGNQIGIFQGGLGTRPLVIQFNEKATGEAVQELARNITFDNFSTTPSTFTRKVNFVLKDGLGMNNTKQMAIISLSR